MFSRVIVSVLDSDADPFPRRCLFAADFFMTPLALKPSAMTPHVTPRRFREPHCLPVRFLTPKSARQMLGGRADCSRWVVWFFCFAGLVLCGCSDPGRDTYPVSGLVRFPDGTVLRDGSVEFEIIGRKPAVTATGQIGPDGTFTLGTFAADDGALAGRHRVAVVSNYVIGTGAERPGMIPETKLDPRYRSFDSSGITLEVEPAENQIVIDVEFAP